MQIYTKSHVSTGLYLDKRRATASGTYPVKVRVSQGKIRKYYSTCLYASVEEWRKIMSSQPRGRLKTTQAKAHRKLQSISLYIENMKEFSFSAFEKGYFNKTGSDNILVDLFKQHIQLLSSEGRVSSAECYHNTITSLKKFKETIRIENITPRFLSAYETWMLCKKNSLATVGIYVRSLRTIINMARNQQMITADEYPFGKMKYQIPQGVNRKKALTVEEIGKMLSYKTKTFSSMERARDLWIFSYLANGMNVKDICRLRYKNLVDQTIIFQRSKTERVNRVSPVLIKVVLHPIMETIIAKWGNENSQPEQFIFPFLREEVTGKKEREVIKSLIKSINTGIKRIAEQVGITKHVTTYSARHSFATILRNNGSPLGFIRESLGHKSIQTTERYLNAYSEDEIKKYTNSLIQF